MKDTCHHCEKPILPGDWVKWEGDGGPDTRAFHWAASDDLPSCWATTHPPLTFGASDLRQTGDPVVKPSHYNWHPSGVECMDIASEFNYFMGNAIKYIWRADHKGKPIEDLKKARNCIDLEIARRLAKQ